LIAEKTGIPPVSFALPGGSKAAPEIKAKIYEKPAFIRKPNTFEEAKVTW